MSYEYNNDGWVARPYTPLYHDLEVGPWIYQMSPFWRRAVGSPTASAHLSGCPLLAGISSLLYFPVPSGWRRIKDGRWVRGKLFFLVKGKLGIEPRVLYFLSVVPSLLYSMKLIVLFLFSTASYHPPSMQCIQVDQNWEWFLQILN